MASIVPDFSNGVFKPDFILLCTRGPARAWGEGWTWPDQPVKMLPPLSRLARHGSHLFHFIAWIEILLFANITIISIPIGQNVASFVKICQAFENVEWIHSQILFAVLKAREASSHTPTAFSRIDMSLIGIQRIPDLNWSVHFIRFPASDQLTKIPNLVGSKFKAYSAKPIDRNAANST